MAAHSGSEKIPTVTDQTLEHEVHAAVQADFFEAIVCDCGMLLRSSTPLDREKER